jgi:hypothetical protein
MLVVVVVGHGARVHRRAHHLAQRVQLVVVVARAALWPRQRGHQLAETHASLLLLLLLVMLVRVLARVLLAVVLLMLMLRMLRMLLVLVVLRVLLRMLLLLLLVLTNNLRWRNGALRRLRVRTRESRSRRGSR